MGGDASSLDISVLPKAPLSAVEAAWRQIEERADNSFFVSSYWIKAWLRAAAPSGTLFVASREGSPVGAALVVRAPRSLRNPLRTQYRLHETGVMRTDGLFVEYNAVLADPALAAQVLPAILSALKGEAQSGWGRIAPAEGDADVSRGSESEGILQ